MTAQHTQESWDYEKFISNEGHVTFEIFRANALRRSLGRVDIAYSQVFSTYTDESVDGQEANARLMAAAPDLLAALRKLVAEVNDFQSLFGDVGIRAKEAQASIAQATGGAA